jgi:hypothetical protein
MIYTHDLGRPSCSCGVGSHGGKEERRVQLLPRIVVVAAAAITAAVASMVCVV